MTEGRTCVVIDDVQVALDHMTELGRQIASDAANSIRSETLSFARRRGWNVVPHSTFANWALRQIEESGFDWLLLDPLFTNQNVERAQSFRVTRQFNGFSIDADHLPAVVSEGASIGVLDDAASSGATLREVVRRINRANARVERIVVCASSRAARAFIANAQRGIAWADLFAGDYATMHLRDGCAYLPFTGRRMAIRVAGDSCEPTFEVRTPSATIPGSVWHSLVVVRAIHDAIEQGTRQVLERFAAKLGRSPTVGDLPLLGANVPAAATHARRIDASTQLQELLLPA